MRKIYISGPIAGKPDRNRAEFGVAETWLRTHGFVPVNPLTLPPWEHEGDCPPGYGTSEGHSSSCHLRTDLQWLLDCDAMLLLDGWEDSRGCAVEIYVAKAVGIPSFLTLTTLLNASRRLHAEAERAEEEALSDG